MACFKVLSSQVSPSSGRDLSHGVLYCHVYFENNILISFLCICISVFVPSPRFLLQSYLCLFLLFRRLFLPLFPLCLLLQPLLYSCSSPLIYLFLCFYFLIHFNISSFLPSWLLYFLSVNCHALLRHPIGLV